MSPETTNVKEIPAPPGKLFETFFTKRVVGSLLLIFFTIAGLTSYLSLVKEDSPDLKIPFASIETEWPGADPESIEKRITNKIEEKIKATPDLKRYESASYNSYSVITAEFYPDSDADICVANLRAEVEKVSDLPGDAKKPVITKSSVNDVPILTVNLYGEINTGMKNRTAEALKDELLMIPGVREVKINGQRKDEVFILYDNDILLSLGISSETIKDALVDAHVDMPLEDVESDIFSPSLKLVGRFRDMSDLKNLTVTRIGERPVLLRELAEVRRDLARKKSITRMSFKGSDFREALSLDILKAPGADTLFIIDKAKSVLARFADNQRWPAGLNYAITDDSSVTIWDSLSNVFSNGWQAVLLVMLVLLLAMSWREALVAGLSIPVTILSVIALLPAMGYTFNKLVIIGIVLALGMLVDVFILMMEGMHENIYAQQLDFRSSAAKTVKTYAIPALTGQLTTILAFMPLAFIGGISGKFIRIIPVIVSVTLFMSYLIAIFIDIPLSYYVFKGVAGTGASGKTFVDRINDSIMEWFKDLSSRTFLRNRATAIASIACTVIILVFSIYTAGFLQNEMFPKSDSLTLGATIEMSPDTTLEKADKVAVVISEILRNKPFIESVVSYSGLRSPMAKNSNLLVKEAYYLIGFGCRFVPKNERNVKVSHEYLPAIREEIEKKLDEIAPGSTVIFYVESGGAGGGAPVQLKLVGNNMATLRKLSNTMQGVLKKIPGTSDVMDNLGPAKTGMNLTIDREAADFYKIKASSIGAQLRYATGADEIAQYPAEDSKEELKIRLGALWPSRKKQPGGPMSIDELSKIYAVSDDNVPVNLASILDSRTGQNPLSITHSAGTRTVIVTCETDRRPAGEIVQDIEKKIASMKSSGEWPDSVSYSFGGENEEMEETYGGIGKIILIALFLVFSVLALQFGNFKQPFIIITSVPFALIGVILGFFLIGLPFSFTAAIGVISLIGVAVNNAIVMVDTMNTLREEGRTLGEAALLGGSMRLRPIAVTTVTTIAGLIPLSMSDPAWKPLCLAIIFGLITSTFISLVIIPCLYLLFSPKEIN